MNKKLFVRAAVRFLVVMMVFTCRLHAQAIQKISVRYCNLDQQTNPQYNYMRQFGTWRAKDSIFLVKQITSPADTLDLRKFEASLKSDFIFLLPVLPDTIVAKKTWKQKFSIAQKVKNDTTIFTYKYATPQTSPWYWTQKAVFDKDKKLIQYYFTDHVNRKWYTYAYSGNQLISIDDGWGTYFIEYTSAGKIKKVSKSDWYDGKSYKDSFIEFVYE